MEVLGDRLTARQRAQAVVEGAILGTYHFDRYKREKAEKTVTELRIVEPDARRAREAADGMRRGESFALATSLARDLINAPANDLHPTDLARAATELGEDGSRLSVKVYDRAECRKMGMGAFLGVAAGSEQPPKFIHLTYNPPGRPAARPQAQEGRAHRQGHHVRLRRARSQASRRHAAHEVRHGRRRRRARGSCARCRRSSPPVEVHGLIAATENMPSGSAIRPGDVLRAMNGTTIEIGNTDAEGRLTLADGLCYAITNIQADEIIDMATLTGACVIALGQLCSGLMTNNQALANRLLRAADAAGERLWQLPLIDEYRENLKSEVADLNNVGPRGGGAITAGLFLKEFAGKTPWAHLDIAGPAFTEKDLPLAPKGATGFAVRTVLTYLGD